MENSAEEEEDKKFMFISLSYILIMFMLFFIYAISNQNLYILFFTIIYVSGFIIFPLRAAYTEFKKPKSKLERRNDILASLFGSGLTLSTGIIIFLTDWNLIISPQLTNENDIITFFLWSLSIPLIILGIGIIIIMLMFTIKLPN